MKQCSECKETKSLEEFQKCAKNKDGLTGRCKPCKRAYDNAHYKKNPDRRSYIRENSEKRIAETKAWVGQYLMTHPCIDCGETDPIVLEFDHRADKEFNIATKINYFALSRIIVEIEKCDVRCANCHRRKTARDFGYWKTLLG